MLSQIETFLILRKVVLVNKSKINDIKLTFMQIISGFKNNRWQQNQEKHCRRKRLQLLRIFGGQHPHEESDDRAQKDDGQRLGQIVTLESENGVNQEDAQNQHGQDEEDGQRVGMLLLRRALFG